MIRNGLAVWPSRRFAAQKAKKNDQNINRAVLGI
jgi:hypothetical protein